MADELDRHRDLGRLPRACGTARAGRGARGSIISIVANFAAMLLTAGLVVGNGGCAGGGVPPALMSGLAIGLSQQGAWPSPATGDDAVARDIVLTRDDVPPDWKEVFDPPSESNMNRVAWRCLDYAAARPSGEFASANYIRDDALTYSFVTMYPDDDAAAAGFGRFTERWVPACVCGQDCLAVKVEAFPGVGDQSIVLRFLFDDPTRPYFDLAILQQGRAVAFLLYRNRTGPFPAELRDHLLRSMLARAAQQGGG